MAHVLILGMTESGKSTLAKKMIQSYKSQNIKTLVLDPLNDPGWKADYVTDDPDEFLEVYWESRRCAVFIDEAGESAGQYDIAMQKTATRGRHWGHINHYVTQRGPGSLARVVRDQCSSLFLFATARHDAEQHAREWNNDGLAEAFNLPQGDYLHVTRFGKIQRGSAFN